MNKQRFRFAFRAMGWHVLASVTVAGFASWVVFGAWYPSEYATMLGGFTLFALVVSVDVVCGPLLTFVLCDPQKSRRELALDLSIVAVLQLAALGYGLTTLWEARPVYLVYDIDRFHAVTRANISPEDWQLKPDNVPNASWWGPSMAAVRVAKPEDADYLSQVQLSISGLAAAYRPDRWMPYAMAAPEVREKALPLPALYAKHPEAKLLIDDAVVTTGKRPDQLRWVPVQSRRNTDWVALLDYSSLSVMKFLPLDGF